MWDLSSSTRDHTGTPCIEGTESQPQVPTIGYKVAPFATIKLL